MRRIENPSATGLATVFEVALVVALLGIALVMPLVGDQMVDTISALIANLHAS